MDEPLGLIKEDEETGEFIAVPPAESNRVIVDVAAYNSKYYYVQGDVGAPGRLPITGNETVLDAVQFAGGLMPTAAPQNVRLVRPAPPGACCEQVLPVNLSAIINAGDPTTNYQLMPGDRLMVYRDPIVRGTIFLERIAAPFFTVVNGVQSYSFAANSVRYLNFPINQLYGGAGNTRTGRSAVPVSSSLLPR
jgi:polysaccharide export outer membrane protein